jgi:ferredoxin-NADP reductase
MIEPAHRLVVTGKKTIAQDVVELTLRDPAGRPLPDWSPGAHVDLATGAGLSRQYSLCGHPADRDSYTVAVLREPAGRGGSQYVHDVLAVGDEVGVTGPRNHFELVRASGYLFVAGGIGITPLLPMLAEVHAAGLPWRLLYGGRTRASMAFTGRLLRDYGDRVTICPQDETGLLDLASVLATPTAGTSIYCCGPEPLLTAVEQWCVRWPPDALRAERFTPRTPEEDRPDSLFEVELKQSGMTLTVPPGRSIVDVVEEAGVSPMYSCGEGTCGTCETRVIDGRPDHRDSVLSGPEREENATMMICVSRSLGKRLVLDL